MILTLVAVFGRPGSGKTTLGDKLAVRHGFTHLALGRILRDPSVQKEIGIDRAKWEAAVAVGRTITTPRLYPWLDERIRATSMVVVDRYPRAAVSAKHFQALVASLPSSRPVHALLLVCAPEVTRRRLEARQRADDDGRIMHRNDEYERVQQPLAASLPASVARLKIDSSRLAAEVFADAEAAMGLSRQDWRF